MQKLKSYQIMVLVKSDRQTVFIEVIIIFVLMAILSCSFKQFQFNYTAFLDTTLLCLALLYL